ncbi:hypothetical protein EKO23_13190 [Nocardioides guangzhouensis]|uniref:Uncharacterized protein n=1 Tax=Nocardioides guangzhouensis TaxID=2497878 RepID=A0A4Q4ZB76_9ACTN|nr:hypothetical protein [Nocardioides guangzhouensis]RYP85207.1 hypothetical protein EKO23_13190 [Nocardioides guangzhouensis]
MSWTGRLAWLLRSWRLHRPDAPLADPAAFARALTGNGCPATPEQVVAWESGAVDPPYAAWVGYERVLGLDHCLLASSREYLRVSLPAGSLPQVLAPTDKDSDHFEHDRKRLLAAAATGRATPIQWTALGSHLTADQDWAPEGEEVQALCDEIVTQLARGVDASYRLISIAAAGLAQVAALRAPLVTSIRGYLGDPDVQVVHDPLGLLDQISSPEAADLVLDLLEKAPNRALYLHAVWQATQMVLRGGFDDRQRARLGVLVLARWRADPTQAPVDLAQLIAVLPTGFREAFSRAAQQWGNTDFGYVLEHGEDVTAESAERLATRLVNAVAAADPAAMESDRGELASLVRESLFHRESERRHLGSVLLSASPYAAGLGEAALDALSERDTVSLARGRAATLCTYLATEHHRLRLSPFVGDPDETVAAAVTIALGHIEFATTTDQVLRHMIPTQPGSLGRGHMYALGMTGSPGLSAIASSSSAPDWQRRAARWWLRTGPAIRHPQ